MRKKETTFSIETDRDEKPQDVLLRHDGQAFWTPQRRYATECFLDLTNYPYDRHRCHIWIQSLAGMSKHLDLRLYGELMEDSATWDLETYMNSKADTQVRAVVLLINPWDHCKTGLCTPEFGG